VVSICIEPLLARPKLCNLLDIMNAPLPPHMRFDVSALVNAIVHDQAEDSLRNPFTTAQWDTLAPYLQPVALSSGDVLMRQGDVDSTLYLVESGTLSVHYEDAKGRVRLAMVGAGTVLGEGGFFSHHERRATVQAAAACKLWALVALRYTELCNRQPAIALALTQAAGRVLALRAGNRRRRPAMA
jgi:CRP/FNR family transcriptional regulator, cyclic AMP receptor protein